VAVASIITPSDPVSDAHYVPAAGRAAFTGLYDQVMAWTMREGTWRPRLTDAVIAGLPPGGTVVDVGCGTATQAIAIARARPDARVIGVDGDPQVLALAAAKRGGGEQLELIEGLAGGLPLPTGSADRVILSLVLHHLLPDAKRAALGEVRRVLSAGGELHVMDWGRPGDPLTRAGFATLQLLDGRANTRDHASGRWLDLFAEAGFAPPRMLGRLRTPWGELQQLAVGRGPAAASAGHEPSV
jgi:SAM-dependent methyltransferase